MHGMCGIWGGIAAGVFGLQALGGLGGVSFIVQFLGSLFGVVVALSGGFLVYGSIKWIAGLRLSAEQEFNGADLSVHRIGASSMD
jgi:Amt family ammonium transporter